MIFWAQSMDTIAIHALINEADSLCNVICTALRSDCDTQSKKRLTQGVAPDA